jgi:HEAT repeat protein
MSDRPDSSSNHLPKLEQQLRSFALNERIGALNQLATIDSAVAVPVLERLAAEKDFMFRRLAVMGLANHRTEEAFQVLQGLIDREEDHSVLAEAANSMFEFGDRSIPILLNIFERSSHWLVRQTIISILVETDHDQALFQVATEALQDETQTVKEAGILAIAKIWRSPLAPQAFALIKTLAQDGFWRNRWRAAIALSGCLLPESRELLSKLQTDEHYRVVAAALEVMAAS